MTSHQRSPRRSRTFRLFFTGLLLVTGTTVGAVSQATHERLQITAGRPRLMVADAIAQASHRLENPSCVQVLTDFTDARGHTLLANLLATSQTAPQYLGLVWFVEAPDAKACENSGTIMAFTQPGSRLVAICLSHFLELPFSLREVVVIHEMLHSLGLGENPPSSADITKQVIKRCDVRGGAGPKPPVLCSRP